MKETGVFAASLTSTSSSLSIFEIKGTFWYSSLGLLDFVDSVHMGCV